MICYHHNDLDGRCAGAIVLKKSPECRMREINYNDNPDFSKEVKEDEEVFIVDFSFKPNKLSELFKITTNMIWIDHHKMAKKYLYDFYLKGLLDFSEPGLSGCELTWNYLFPEESMPEAVKLLGDYDTWRFDTKEQSMAFQFGLRSEPNKPNDVIWHKLLAGCGCTQLQTSGQAVIKYKNNQNKALLKHRYEIFWEDHNCLVVNTPMLDSAMFEEYKNQFDIYLCWYKISTGFSVSMRSNNSHVDVSEIAKKYGGGGHKEAAGFVCNRLPWEQERGK